MIDEKVTIEIVCGVEGKCIVINAYRVAGSKPWCGGTVENRWVVDKQEFFRALGNKKQPKVVEWIPCSERLPKLEEVVLLSVKMDEEPMVLMGELWKSGWTLHCDGYDEEDFEFIAWMPLPTAYKGE